MDTGIDLAEIHLKGAVMMAQIIESIPEARLLLMSLRSVGYTEETAIADIIAVSYTHLDVYKRQVYG